MATLAIRYSTGTQATAYTTALWLHSSTGNFDEGWKIRYDGWVQGVSQYSNGEWGNVEEKVTLKITGTSPDDLSTKTQALDTIVNDIQYHIDSNSSRIYWLFTALTGESCYLGERNQTETDDQAYRICPIIGIASSYNEGLFGTAGDGGSIVLQYTIIIKRLPLWEAETLTVSAIAEKTRFSLIDANANIPTVGGTASLLPTVYGTSTSRIVSMSLSTPSSLVTGAVTEAWVGFRGPELGTPSLFVPVWEMEDTAAGNRGADTSVASEGSDTSPSGSTSSNKLRCTFSGTTSMASRAIVTITDVTTSAQRDDQRGRHLVLLRAKVDGDRTAYVRMDSAYSSATNWRTGTRIKVDSTSWYLYPLGYVTIPSIRMTEVEAVLGGAATFANFGIKINAESAGGSSGNLDMDCLVLIPQDDGAVYINNANMQYVSPESFGAAYVYTDPLWNQHGANYSAGSDFVTSLLEAQFQHFALPIGPDIVIVLAAQQSSSQVLTDVLTVGIDARFRWRSLRGSEGLIQE